MTISKAEMQDAFERALRNYGAATGGGGGGGGGGFGGGGGGSGSGGSGGFSLTEKSLDFLKNGLQKAGDSAKDFADKVTGNLNVWRELSRNGSNFSNDLIGMTAAAASSRVELHDFADIIKRNGKDFAGLGGSVTRGSEAFAKLSKAFFDGAIVNTEGLKAMGYTSKELNEVLALQVATTRSSTRNTIDGQKQSLESAKALAEEMDMTSKLMGKNREQQMEQMKELQRDAAVQAKLRLDTKGMSAKDAAEYKTQVMAALKQAAEQGKGEAAKEIYTAGTVVSKTGAQQASLYQKEISAFGSQLKAIKEKDYEAAKKYGELSREESVKSLDDPTLNRVTALGSAAGDLEGTLVKGAQANQTLYDAIDSVRQAHKERTGEELSYKDAMKQARDEISASRTGKGPDGKDVGGATRGAIAVESAGQELKAALAGIALATDKEGKSIAGALRKVGDALNDGYKKLSGPGSSIGKNVTDRANLGQLGFTEEIVEPGVGKDVAARRKQQGAGGAIGEATSLASKLANITADKISSMIVTTAENVKFLGKVELPVRHTGTLGETGQTSEPQDIVALIKKGEFVGTPEQMKNLLSGAQMQGAADAINGIMPRSSTITSPKISSESRNLQTSQSYTDTFVAKVLKVGEMPAVKMDVKTPAASTATKTQPTPAASTATKTQPPPAASTATKTQPTPVASTDPASAATQSMSSTKMAKVASDVDTEFGDLAGAMAKVAADADTEFGDLAGAMAKVAADVDTEFGDLAGAMAKVAADVDTEFGDLAGAMAKVAADVDTEFGDLAGAMAKVAADVDTEFGDLAGAMAKVAADADTEFGDLAGAMAKVAADVDTEFGDLAGAMAKVAADVDTEFGDLAGAMAKVAADVDTEFGDLAGAMAKVAADADTEFGDLAGAMAKVAADVDTEFGDLAGAMAKVAADVDTEFGDLAGAMAKVAADVDTEFGDLAGAMAKVAADVDTEFGDLAGAMAKVAADVDTEFGDLAGAMAKVAADVPTSGASAFDLANMEPQGESSADAIEELLQESRKGSIVQQSVDTEFGDLEGAIQRNKEDDEKRSELARESRKGAASIGTAAPTAMSMIGPDGKLNLDALMGGKGFGLGNELKSAQKSIPSAEEQKTKDETSAESKRLASIAEKKSETKQGETKQGETKQGGKSATLDDVVKQLEKLNSSIVRLSDQQGTLLNKQISVTKSNSSNVYDKAC